MEDIYQELRKKFSLPEFNILDQEFEIGSIDEDEHFPLREIRKKIDDKIEGITKIMEEVLHPERSIASFREANAFTDKEREDLLELYSRLMFFHRRTTELYIEDSEEENAEFIKELMKEWPELKKKTLGFVKKLKESWKKEITKKEVVGYLG